MYRSRLPWHLLLRNGRLGGFDNILLEIWFYWRLIVFRHLLSCSRHNWISVALNRMLIFLIWLIFLMPILIFLVLYIFICIVLASIVVVLVLLFRLYVVSAIVHSIVHHLLLELVSQIVKACFLPCSILLVVLLDEASACACPFLLKVMCSLL